MVTKESEVITVLEQLLIPLKIMIFYGFGYQMIKLKCLILSQLLHMLIRHIIWIFQKLTQQAITKIRFLLMGEYLEYKPLTLLTINILGSLYHSDIQVLMYSVYNTVMKVGSREWDSVKIHGTTLTDIYIAIER